MNFVVVMMVKATVLGHCSRPLAKQKGGHLIGINQFSIVR